MKKLLASDKQLRENLQKADKQQYVLKLLFKNDNLSALMRWKAFLKLKDLAKKNSNTAISPRCVLTINKKRFNKMTLFSRHVFLKSIRSGRISGFKKSSW